MKHRNFRIAWSASCAILAALLIALWVQSYAAYLEFRVPGRSLWINSHHSKATLLSTGRPYDSMRRLRLTIPYWLPVSAAGMLGVFPWLPVRFGLRTLLIAMTLVAVGFGLIAWMR
jgi:hypothetical protein